MRTNIKEPTPETQLDRRVRQYQNGDTMRSVRDSKQR